MWNNNSVGEMEKEKITCEQKTLGLREDHGNLQNGIMKKRYKSDGERWDKILL